MTRFDSPLRPRVGAASAAVIATAVVLAAPVRAQAPAGEDPSGTVALRGTVVSPDHRPVSGAVVRLDGTGAVAITDAEGRFLMADVPAGVVTLSFEQIGYAPLRLTRAAGADPAPVDVTLEPRPDVLEGLRVTVDRLRARRNSTGVAVRVLGPGDFARQSKELILAVRYRGGLRVRPCTDGAAGSYWCVDRQGETFEPVVFVDEQPSVMGLDELESHWTEDVYAVEIYQFGAALRIYTRSYIEGVALDPRPFRPVWIR